ncbi:MAG TPA: hypothetical protein DIW64_15615 [Cellvibrio sp.]|nr:hypothetical protein [Cellvibrio sp.]
MAPEPLIVRCKVEVAFGYKPLSHKDLAGDVACLARLNMLLFLPTIKKRSDCIALLLHHFAGFAKRIG